MRSSSSKTDLPPLPARLLVGRVARAHGVRGEVAVLVLSDDESRFRPGSRLIWSAGGDERRLEVVASRTGTHGTLVGFAGVADRDAAEALRGGDLEVERDAAAPAPAGSYHHYELLGALCVDRRRGELGPVVDLAEGPAGLLLEVELADGRRLPLPFVERFLVGVDRRARRIDWDLPEGLIEACASAS